ncbi:putative broad-Complex, Tramtrack and Bric a brac [Lyophyllum shimeji]|uniref:Broad-Complex, Tramtrack and Bric a brac n=1 Tax=Lyophyllum shimeji TaxID=47721 RepID=A0A9P3UKQ2_LYOSH|nr:putative broad-Complex, Tramtrack and Bric a brac [Lyophyllum shimeji]
MDGPGTCSSSFRSAFSNLIRSDFWFLDGNIIIIAGQAAFKVHRGQLERHSDVFNGLFSIPQPQDVDLFEGCLYVELHDNPSDVFYFLSALYDGLYFKTPRADDFMAIAGILRLSTKYLVEHLRQRCLTRLDLDWPSTLAGWDHRERAATDSLGRYMPRESCPHPVLVIELALDLGIPSILAAAFYDLSRYGPSKIMTGAPRPATALDQYIPQSQRAPAAQTVTLPRALLRQTLRGREHVQAFMANFIATSLHSRAPAVDCLHQHDAEPSRSCQESFYFIMLNILRAVGGIAHGRDADTLFTLNQAMEMLSRTDFSDGQRQCGLKMCHPCKVDFAACATKAREEVWASLPVWFGLTEPQPADVLPK